jgi:hypothetical protein
MPKPDCQGKSLITNCRSDFMLNLVTVKDYYSSHVWNHIYNFVRKVQPQLSKLTLRISFFDFFKIWVKVNNKCELSQFFSVFDVILIQSKSILVPQVIFTMAIIDCKLYFFVINFLIFFCILIDESLYLIELFEKMFNLVEISIIR